MRGAYCTTTMAWCPNHNLLVKQVCVRNNNKSKIEENRCHLGAQTLAFGRKQRRHDRSCDMRSKPEACYLKYEIAFAVFRLVDLRTEAPPSFRSLFLEILQDLEKAKNTRQQRKAWHARIPEVRLLFCWCVYESMKD